jgi:nucleotide-binding universal stress UspA family protein
MFKRMLVPLDGSTLAESALPVAANLAGRLGIPVTLLHVIERDAPRAVHGDRHLTDPAEAEAYLAEMSAGMLHSGQSVEWHVHDTGVGDVARSLVEHVAELNPDLIVMCTHGRGGPGQWLFGSIAQQVIGRGTTPVLVVPAGKAAHPPDFDLRQLLVPVDGLPDHAQGVPVAAGLARACEARLHLVWVVPTPGTMSGGWGAAGRLMPGTTRALLEHARQGAKEYLAIRAAELGAAGVAATVEVGRGDPVRVILQTSRRIAADLVVLGTHGKRGLDAFWAGSVAARVVNRSRVPLLLVPVAETPAEG